MQRSPSIEAAAQTSADESVRLPLNKRFGERLRTLRSAKNLTQKELAKHLGMDRSFISDMELGKKNASLDTIEILALGFGVSMAELMRGL